jgi:hypothetical protein
LNRRPEDQILRILHALIALLAELCNGIGRFANLTCIFEMNFKFKIICI